MGGSIYIIVLTLFHDIGIRRGACSVCYTCTRVQIKDWAGRTSIVDTVAVVADVAVREDEENNVGVARIRRH